MLGVERIVSPPHEKWLAKVLMNVHMKYAGPALLLNSNVHAVQAQEAPVPPSPSKTLSIPASEMSQDIGPGARGL